MDNNLKRVGIFSFFLLLIILTSAAFLGISAYNIFLNTANAQRPVPRENEQEATAVEVEKIKKDNFYIYTTVSAVAEASEELNLTPRLQEVVTEVKVDMGQEVEAGELLVQMDSRSNEISITQAEASLKSAEASLQKAKNGPRQAEIEQLEAQLTQAKSELKLRRENYERQKQLFEEEYLSQEEIDQAHNRLIAAQSSYQSALKNMELTKAGASKEDIAQLESQLTQAKAQLEQAKLQLSYTKIKSPIKGIVSQINARPGQMIGNGVTAVISNIEKIKLTAYVSEQNINDLMVGEKAKVNFNAIDDNFEAEIISISPRTAENRRSFPVELMVENSNKIIKAGMTSQVSLIVDRAENSLIIPQNAILNNEKQPYIFVIDGEKARKIKIEILLEDEDKAAVSADIKAGSKIVTLGKESLSDGSSVDIIERGDQ